MKQLHKNSSQKLNSIEAYASCMCIMAACTCFACSCSCGSNTSLSSQKRVETSSSGTNSINYRSENRIRTK